MSIKGIGIDIEEITRFSVKKIERNRTFYKKIFTSNEINYCLKKNNPYPHFASRFCAKEALVKALVTSSLEFKDIEIIIKNNQPTLKFAGKNKTFLSLSHTSKYAIAVVVVETI